MIVSKTYAKLKKLKPVMYAKIRGRDTETFCVLDDDRDVKGREFKVDYDDIFGKHISIKSDINKVNKLFLSFDPAAKNVKNINDDGIRTIHYIVGGSGSGKTFYSAQLASEYLDCYPDNKLIFISSKPPSTDFKRLRPDIINVVDPDKAYYNWIDPETKIKFIPGQPSEIDNSCIVIDDIEAIPDKSVKAAVEELLNSILTVGRANNITVFYLKHNACDHKSTKTILLEAHYITVFKNNLSNRSYLYLLQNYAGLDKKQIDYIKSRNTRAITISIKYPKCLITEDELHIF